MTLSEIAADERLASVGRTLMLDAAAVECMSVLGDEDIRAILLKGPVTARWLYPDAAGRYYLDVDLLVARSEFGRALRILERRGYRDTQARRFANETPPHARALILDRPYDSGRGGRFPAGLPVDLHWSFHGIGVPDQEFWDVISGSAERMRVAATEVEVPNETARALFLPLHAATSGGGVGQALSDLDRALERLSDEQWKAAHELALRLHATPRFLAGLAMRPLGAKLIDRLDLEGEVDVVSALRAAGVPPVAAGVERLRTTRTFSGRMRLLIRELAPTRSFMRAWSPLSTRGAAGLALAYVYRPIWVLFKLPAAARAHARARREVQAARTATPVPADRVAMRRKLRRVAKRFSVARAAYRSSRAARVTRKGPERVWREALPGEVDFWKQVLPDRVTSRDDYRRRADPRAPMQDPIVKMLIARIPEETVAIIDVGAGPLTALGKTYPGKTLNITATDPLAAEYAEIMRNAGIEPPVPPIACRGEDLLQRFQPDTFDVAFARNALDHSADPVRVITNMVHLVKEGRFVVLKHSRSEGRRQFYRGLHQWNFDLEDGEFIIGRPGQAPFRLSQILNGSANVDCFVDPHAWLVCVITKASFRT
jgi:SAM-dependent methyltransferase